MSEITVTETIAVPAERAWALFADIGGIHKFHPSVERSPLQGERETGLGASRVCEFYDGNRIKEKVVGWDEGRSMTIDIVEGTMPLARAQARIEITPVDAGSSEVRFTMDYEPKMGLLGKLMDVTMMRGQFRKILKRVITGLETHATTGAVVGPDGKPVAAGSVAAA